MVVEVGSREKISFSLIWPSTPFPKEGDPEFLILEGSPSSKCWDWWEAPPARLQLAVPEVCLLLSIQLPLPAPWLFFLHHPLYNKSFKVGISYFTLPYQTIITSWLSKSTSSCKIKPVVFKEVIDFQRTRVHSAIWHCSQEVLHYPHRWLFKYPSLSVNWPWLSLSSVLFMVCNPLCCHFCCSISIISTS